MSTVRYNRFETSNILAVIVGIGIAVASWRFLSESGALVLDTVVAIAIVAALSATLFRS